MHRRLPVLVVLLAALALPLAASQFTELPFDQVARESRFIVRGSVLNTWSAWDNAHEVIYTYATVRVGRYFGEATGPDTLTVREVGGSVDGYTQEAIGFPMIRSGEDVVLFLSNWEDSADYRIHAFNQGKYLVRNRGGREIVVPDMVRQGDAGPDRGHDRGIRTESVSNDTTGLLLDELAAMIVDARAGGRTIDQQIERK